MSDEQKLNCTDYTPELLDDVLGILRQKHMATWEWAHRAVRQITGDHKMILKYPVKSLSLAVYDNIGAIIAELKSQLPLAEEDPYPGRTWLMSMGTAVIKRNSDGTLWDVKSTSLYSRASGFDYYWNGTVMDKTGKMIEDAGFGPHFDFIANASPETWTIVEPEGEEPCPLHCHGCGKGNVDLAKRNERWLCDACTILADEPPVSYITDGEVVDAEFEPEAVPCDKGACLMCDKLLDAIPKGKYIGEVVLQAHEPPMGNPVIGFELMDIPEPKPEPWTAETHLAGLIEAIRISNGRNVTEDLETRMLAATNFLSSSMKMDGHNAE